MSDTKIKEINIVLKRNSSNLVLDTLNSIIDERVLEVPVEKIVKNNDSNRFVSR